MLAHKLFIISPGVGLDAALMHTSPGVNYEELVCEHEGDVFP